MLLITIIFFVRNSLCLSNVDEKFIKNLKDKYIITYLISRRWMLLCTKSRVIPNGKLYK